MPSWLLGITAGIVGVLALFVASRADGASGAYGAGLLVAIVCLVILFYAIKRHYDAVEAGDIPADTGRTTGTGSLDMRRLAEMALPFPARNRTDNLVVATLAGGFSAACGIMASYTSGAEAWFGIALFLGLGVLAGVAGLSALITKELDDEEEEEGA